MCYEYTYIYKYKPSESHHLRKFYLRFHSPKSRTLTYSCPPRAPPCAPTLILVDFPRCAMKIVVFEHIER